MVHFAVVVRDGSGVGAQRHIIDGKEHRGALARYGDGTTYQYCLLSSSDSTAADDVVSALLSFPVSTVAGPIARIYAVPKDECATGIEIFQEANETLTVRVGGNDAVRCPSAAWSKPCPPEQADTNLGLRGGVGVKYSNKGSYERECLVRLTWAAKDYGSPASYLKVTYRFPDQPYQTSEVALGVNAALALLRAQTLELTMHVRAEPSFPRVAVLRWGARRSASNVDLQVDELQKAVEFARGEVNDGRNTLTRLGALAAVDSADYYYRQIYRGKPQVRCTLPAQSGRKVVTSCTYR